MFEINFFCCHIVCEYQNMYIGTYVLYVQKKLSECTPVKNREDLEKKKSLSLPLACLTPVFL